MAGWHKLSDKLAEGLLFPQPSLWSDAHPCPMEVACVELSLLASRGHLAQWGERRLAKRWAVSRRQVRTIVGLVEADAVRSGFPWADHFRTPEWTAKRATKSQNNKMLTAVVGPEADHVRTTFGPQHEGYADPAKLFQIWEEERQTSPAALRSRSPGLSAMWSAELVSFGPQRAEMAVRAVAEFCRGTEQPLDWGRFFSARRDGSTWRAALAWKEANSNG